MTTPSAGILEGTTPDDDPSVDAANFGARETGITEDEPALIDQSAFLPQMSQDDFMATLGGMKLPGVFEHNDMAPQAASGGRKKAVDFALGMLGIPYVWGGQSTSGTDCSGLTLQALSRAGVELPRVSFQQATYGARVGLKDLQPGDLVAWDNSSRNNGADHIAIYIGNGEIIEAPRPGVNVRRRKLDPDEDAWGVDMSKAYGG